MKQRSRFSSRTKQTPDTEELIRLATQLSLSGSRLEDAFWERRLANTIERLLHGQDEAALNAALDHLYGAGGRAYDDNGYRPFTLTIGRRPRLMDVNVSAFSVLITVLAMAVVLVARLPAVG